MSAPVSELERAINPRASAWVSANAGAGKTYMLANRVTRLLLDGAEPAKILCLTYTKAAAAEMAKRLFDQLGNWAMAPDAELAEKLITIGAGKQTPESLAAARRLFAQALEAPGGLKIQTIHSFCQYVLSRFPVEAGIPARFTVLDTRSAAELMHAARFDVLRRAHKEEALGNAVAILATRAQDGRFADLIDQAIGGRSEGLRAVLAAYEGDTLRLFEALRAKLGVGPGEDGPDVIAAFCGELAGERSRWAELAQWLQTGSIKDREQSARLMNFLGGNCAPAHYEHIQNFFLTGKGELRKTLATKALVEANPAAHAFLEGFRNRLLAIEERRKAAVTATLTEALVTGASAVLEKYQALKRARAVLDYDDLILSTLALLEQREDAAWVLYKLDGGLDHILIDEAQDTSPEQWDIVTRLAEEFFAGEGSGKAEKPRTLFAVGDEKQSIFSFQGAAPEEFARNRARFQNWAEQARQTFEPLRPKVSRRSTTIILEFVDAVFADAAVRDGLTVDGEPVKHMPVREHLRGRVEIWPSVKPPPKREVDPFGKPLDAPEAEGAHVVLAERIAAQIAGWLQTGLALPSTGKTIRPGDILILVRRRNQFTEEMIRRLIAHKVPVAGADRMVLRDQIAIADLVALGRFALLPEDDLNLASLLKSPLIGFAEDDLFALAHGREGRLWEALQHRSGEYPAFGNALAILAQILAEADFTAPFEFYMHALGRGMRKRLLARLGGEALDAIDEFLALALAHEGAHPPSLQSFLDWFERGADQITRDMEQAGSAVRIMTVHGAKGLEAEIVILPDTTQIPDHERRAGLLQGDGMVYFGVPQEDEPVQIRAAKDQAHQAELREYRRLLYVALTRAREWLIIGGYETRKGVHPESWYLPIAAAARAMGAREEVQADGETILVLGDTPSAQAKPEQEKQTAVLSLPDWLRRPAAPETARPRILRPSEAAGMEEPSLSSPLADQTRFRRGLLLHALLAALPELAPDAREEQAARYLARQDVEEENIAPLVAEAMAIMNDPVFAPLFTGEARAEIPVVADLPELGAGVRISGQIDRLAVTEESVLIADFKTNRPPPSRAEDVPAVYLAQMALYRAALAKIYPGKRINCALIWTDGPSLMPLPPALLDAELKKIAQRLAPK
jgi:ATP-dependent helicase/nuclease subunit A